MQREKGHLFPDKALEITPVGVTAKRELLSRGQTCFSENSCWLEQEEFL